MSTIEVKTPSLPESVADALVATWHKNIGQFVTREESLVDLETDKVMLEVTAPVSGILKQIIKQQGTSVKSNEVLAVIDPAGENKNEAAPALAKPATPTPLIAAPAGPAARRAVQEHNVSPENISGSGKDGRITKQDVIQFVETKSTVPAPIATASGDRLEQRVPMTRLRARIAERLLSAQHNAAILTTFNEINMHAVMTLRLEYKDTFEKKHGVKLGFMSFFTRAVVEALKRFPAVNASIDGNDIVYHGYFDIGIAVSTDRGLVVPIVRNADQLSMADLEKTIGHFGERARNNALTLDELSGGTFTITNGGVFGSLLATPIINPPQSGILGMHKIEERPIAENGLVVIRPMMYVALSYDHRIIDGRESVQFLKTVKELLENPVRLLLDV